MQEIETLKKHWPKINKYLHPPKTEEQCDKIIKIVDELIHIVGDDPNHPLASLLDTLDLFIENFESETLPEPDISPAEIISFLMTEHCLSQSELPEIGSQGVVSEVLAGKRRLNVRQIQKLSERFGISPAVFFDTRFEFKQGKSKEHPDHEVSDAG